MEMGRRAASGIPVSQDTILLHYDLNLDIGISCDASNVGIETMLFHCYPDGSDHPMANASKTLSPTQRRRSQIQREALAVIFGQEVPPLPVLTKVHFG